MLSTYSRRNPLGKSFLPHGHRRWPTPRNPWRRLCGFGADTAGLSHSGAAGALIRWFVLCVSYVSPKPGGIIAQRFQKRDQTPVLKGLGEFGGSPQASVQAEDRTGCGTTPRVRPRARAGIHSIAPTPGKACEAPARPAVLRQALCCQVVSTFLPPRAGECVPRFSHHGNGMERKPRPPRSPRHLPPGLPLRPAIKSLCPPPKCRNMVP